jgi:hypothetical protein
LRALCAQMGRVYIETMSSARALSHSTISGDYFSLRSLMNNLTTQHTWAFTALTPESDPRAHNLEHAHASIKIECLIYFVAHRRQKRFRPSGRGRPAERQAEQKGGARVIYLAAPWRLTPWRKSNFASRTESYARRAPIESAGEIRPRSCDALCRLFIYLFVCFPLI